MFGRKTLEFMLICIGDEMRDSLFDSKNRAEVEVNRINRQAELNTVDVGERFYDSQADSYA